MQTAKKSWLWWVAVTIGIVLVLFGLLVVGGWAFVAGLGAVCILAYRRWSNRGLLVGAGFFFGLSLGILIELLTGRAGGAVILAGAGLGLIGAVLAMRFIVGISRWWLLVPGLAALALAVWTWSGQSAQMQILDSLRTPVIGVCFVAALVEFWLARR